MTRDLDEGPFGDKRDGDVLLSQMIGRAETLYFLPRRREGTAGGRWNSCHWRTPPFGVPLRERGSGAVRSCERWCLAGWAIVRYWMPTQQFTVVRKILQVLVEKGERDCSSLLDRQT
jgi:hypothetical protein